MRWLRVLAPLLLVASLLGVPSAVAAPAPPDAYAYLDNPRMTGEGQQAPHAELRPYADEASAAKRAEQTPYTLALDGQWKLDMSDRPQDVPAGFYGADYDVSAWPDVSVPHTWQTDGLDHPMFRNIATEMVPDDPPRAPRDVNPTGAYARDFELPADWQPRSTFLRFEGVTSGFFVWVNGQYIGYDQGGYVPAEFDLSPALHPGKNRIAVQVHRWGSGSYLEDYDQWRYAGIFRSVWLYSTPNSYLRDATVRADLDENYADATLTTEISLARKENGPAGRHTVTGSLRDASGREVASSTGSADLSGTSAEVTLSTPVRAPAKWTDETPNLYTLVLSLTGPDGRVSHVTSESVGFREITIKDKQLLVNGERVLLKGVNRAETDPDHGRHVPRARQEQDVALMEQLNVNAVRTSHYPSDPYFYELADTHGLWIDDEVDIETHNHESCPNDCLAEKPEWRDAFMERFIAMVQRDKNHPSVLMWDTGNEAGLGAHHYEMAEWAKKFDPSRPLYHQSNSPDGDAPFADVWGPRYPSPEKFAEQAKNTTKPLIFGEYAHAMGNSLGNFREFWDIIRANPATQGGFIWDWAEQNIRQRVLSTPDSSGNDIMAHLSGLPELVDGHRGKAISLSGLDDFVEVYRDRKLDLTGKALTLDAWVKPAKPWAGRYSFVSKGDHQYSLQMVDEQTLEFFVHSGTWRAVQAKVPPGFYENWHRVSGTYDGTALRLYIDGAEVASAPFDGPIDASSGEVNIGRNSELSWSDPSSIGRLANTAVDDVRIYDRALPAAELGTGTAPSGNAVLALDFDRVEDKGSHLSYGASLSGVDGLIGADRFRQPETAQLAWAHQPIRFGWSGHPDSKLAVHNERQFTGTDDLRLRWKVTEGERTIASAEEPLRVAAGETATFTPPIPANPGNVERFLTVEAVTTRAQPLLPAGHVLAHDQFSLGGENIPGLGGAPQAGQVRTAEHEGTVSASGRDFEYTVDKKTGALASIKARGTELLEAGPKLDAWRAPISNETFNWGRAEGEDWRKAGLDRLETTAKSVRTEPEPGGGVRIVVDSTVAAPGRTDAWFDQTMTYRIDPAGGLGLDHRVSPQGGMRKLPYLPRIGVSLALPDRFDKFSWYGRGEQDSYNDRKDGTPIGVYTSTVDEQYVDYYRPQDHGNHTDTRWTTLSDGRDGLLVGGANDVSVTPYDDLDRAAYPFQLQRNDGWVTLHADHAVTGVGDTPNPVRERYQVKADADYSYSLTIRPLTSAEAAR
ncbi:glycoside hydrolase family 2 TIM barrel-domain containing protein [Amycolatopsis nigrescens]|uniref:glycoside hydrolase family 2 TIM barrel-domain containing protein n=1 Tax=Amycolatopsis nigrescens TaxID=381445 RepID=UPI0003A5043C|nr:glycoside hydrolase family 2 TIM barrel-domain containing protein [Amycolatopsis nigrescens]